ncbi:MAG: c-type cytochrome domain-containing protein [Bacteroidota bacterium]
MSLRGLALAGVAAIVALSCKDENITGLGDSPSNVVFPTRDVSYAVHVQILFNQTCALGGCHDNGPHQSPLRLTEYGYAVLTIPGVVVAGKPDESTLVFRIEGRVGERMPPPPSNPLNQNQINGIRTWIAEGAKNN